MSDDRVSIPIDPKLKLHAEYLLDMASVAESARLENRERDFVDQRRGMKLSWYNIWCFCHEILRLIQRNRQLESELQQTKSRLKCYAQEQLRFVLAEYQIRIRERRKRVQFSEKSRLEYYMYAWAIGKCLIDSCDLVTQELDELRELHDLAGGWWIWKDPNWTFYEDADFGELYHRWYSRSS
jgi:hypothetical protein